MVCALWLVAVAGCAKRQTAGGFSTPALSAIVTPPPDPAAGSQTDGYIGYQGSIIEVMQQFQADIDAAKQPYADLKRQLAEEKSQRQRALIHVRIGALYDNIAERLRATREPYLKFFSDEQEQQLRDAETSSDSEVVEGAALVRKSVDPRWRSLTGQAWADVTRVAVRHYAVAVELNKEYQLKEPAVTAVVQRLTALGEALNQQDKRPAEGAAKPDQSKR